MSSIPVELSAMSGGADLDATRKPPADVQNEIDADTNDASTHAHAQQTQQLAEQSLPVADRNSQLILKLFQ